MLLCVLVVSVPFLVKTNPSKFEVVDGVDARYDHQMKFELLKFYDWLSSFGRYLVPVLFLYSFLHKPSKGTKFHRFG